MCLVTWCAAFLLNRQQCVKVGDTCSPLVTLNAGTPQSTLLGPLAFIVHLGDFDTPSPVEDYIYVDDTSSCSASNDPLSHHLQDAADYAQSWSDVNDMKINATKTKEMVFSTSKHPLTLTPISVGDSEIEQVTSSKLLGVTLCSDLTWNMHVDTLVAKANTRLYLLLHLKRSGVSQQDLVKLYKSMIRSVTEYAAPVWHSSLPVYLSKEIERIQRRALRTIYGEG